MSSLDLSSARVLVCGATGGIGAALVGELTQRGARVTAVGRDRDRLAALTSDAVLCADLSDPDACARAVDLARDGETLDVLINAVGVAAFGPVTDLSSADIRRVLDTNVMIPVLLARAALEHMSRGGVIANISGVIAEPGKAMANMALYAASKAAVRGLDEALARDARRLGVRVIDIRPPHTDTGLGDRAIVGRPPALAVGLAPGHVARVICDGVQSGVRELPSEAFL